VLQTTDGLNRIALWDDRIKITTPLFEVDAADSMFTGDIVAMGTITGQTDVIADTVSGKNHDHDQPNDSAGNTEATTDPPN